MTDEQAARWADDEGARVVARRRGLGWSDAATVASPRWGLALSGGGIRSATFALGVLQGLVRARPPSPAQAEQEATARPEPHRSLLARFDYLSTVSGGGYIGSFFASLFIPGRLRGERTQPSDGSVSALANTLVRIKARMLRAPKQERRAAPQPVSPGVVAREAYAVFTHEPPGRLQSNPEAAAAASTATSGAAAMAWLRENGRYLTPTGAGDFVYAAAGAIRNWCAVHYVIGEVLFTVFALIALVRIALSAVFPAYHDYELVLLQRALGWRDDSTAPIWWSVLWWLPLTTLLLWLLPGGVAYWFSYPNPGQTPNDRSDPFNRAALSAVLVVAVVIAAGGWVIVKDPDSNWRMLYVALVALAIPAAIAFFVHVVAAALTDTIAEERVRLTRYLSAGLAVTLALVMLAVVDTAAQSLYMWIPNWTLGWPMGSLAALVWAVRKIAFGSEKDANPTWVTRIPMEAITNAAGFVVAFLVLVIWDLVVLWAATGHTDPGVIFELDVRDQVWIAVGLASLGLLLCATTARYPGFINLSTLQFVYGERLSRAYLGASNGLRFSPDVPPETRARWRSVAEPVREDSITYETYYGADVLAPVHIINVTVNQTTDAAEQIVQRDRKGLPLAITPNGFLIDGARYLLKASEDRSEVGVPLSIGQWVSLSGAAFSTGLGKQTSLGMSLLLGLANVRLGRWWPSGAARVPSGLRSTWASTFTTQVYLGYELTAKFYGLRREWQYLSDGGHFENTAAYELLRPERALKLIVVCDDGCDPAYQFGDLGNLVRMARIDHGLEIELDREVAAGELGEVFATPEQLALPAGDSNKCALLYWVYPTGIGDAAERTPLAALIVLKPKLVCDAPLDLKEYAATHPKFPQEPTIDQFFDEAQWESYRKLGLAIAEAVFAPAGRRREALWRHLESRLGTLA
jgi:hypothetical protein